MPQYTSLRKRLFMALTLLGVIATLPAQSQVPRPPVLHALDSPSTPNECANKPPAWIFCTSFEEGNLDLWDDYDGNPSSTNLLMQDAGPWGLSGNHVMRLRVPSGGGAADAVKVLPAGHHKLFARWYMKWEPGYDFSARNHGSGFHGGSRSLLGRSDFRPTGNDWYSTWLEPLPPYQKLNLYTYYRGMYMDCSNPSGSCWGDHFPCMLDEGSGYCTNPAHRDDDRLPTVIAGQWYCLELMLDGGDASQSQSTANGSQSFWIDGIEIGPWSQLWFRSSPSLDISIFWLNIYHHDQHSVEGALYDNVVVSTTRVGCT